MKTKHLLMAGLGLISFVGMSLSSVKKAFGQERVIEYQGRPFLAVKQGYDVGPHIRCSRDGEHCFNLNFVGCDQSLQTCFYQLSLINRKTMFHDSSNATLCWGSGDFAAMGIALRAIDCRIYGVPQEISEYNRRRGQRVREQLRRSRQRRLELQY